MPELPEVETIKEDLNKTLKALTIQSIKILDERVIQGQPQKFLQSLQGKTIKQVSRRAKAVIIHFTDQTFLIVHLKMTGQLIVAKAVQDLMIKETKVIFMLSKNWVLVYNDQRVFGKLTFVKRLDECSYLNNVGPEPLEQDANVGWLAQELKKRKSPIKPLLMNQMFVAGIGNIYASEILFEARISPTRQASRLKSGEVEKLHKAIQDILKSAIKWRGCSMRNYRDSAGEKGLFMNKIKVYARQEKN